MNFKPSQLENTLKNIGTNIKCIVLFGTNEGAIADLQKKCAEAVCGSTQDAFNYVQLNMEDIAKDGGEVYAEFHAQSLMGGRRAIVVKNADNNLTPLLKNMLPETKSENVLILSSLSLNTRSSLITWAKDREEVIIPDDISRTKEMGKNVATKRSNRHEILETRHRDLLRRTTRRPR